MREIKFRAWAKYGEMLPNVQNHIGSDGWAFGNMLNSDDFVIMQYTGLKDKNGVEIYEGDIIDCGINQPLVVKFYNGCFVACDNDNDLEFYLLDDYDFEVIGNIYQNPELLEGEL